MITQGTWQVESPYIVIDEHKGVIADCSCCLKGADECNDNARLIAAAKELLAVCKLLLLADGEDDDGYNDSLFISQVHCAIDKSKQAIAKVEQK